MSSRPAPVWTAALLSVAAMVLLVEWADRPPAPRGTDAPATEFSEARARPVMDSLAGRIGHRTLGSAGAERALAYLVRTLDTVPGVQLRVQDWAGARAPVSRWGSTSLYRARNLLVRVPGDSAAAVLVSAHYDSPPESVGAGDDAAAVAAMTETIRALAAGPRLRHSVIFNLNTGEEAGLLGSSAFLHDPWARDVRAFLNLESAGPGGKAILFQAGPGNAWLARAYARVPHPYGTVLAQDIFQGGAIPSDTDFRVYRGGGLRGLDVALYQDGWAYHTARDRPARVAPGTIQHLGDNTLALVRELAAGPLPGDVGGPPAVYWDLLGRWMWVYSARTAALLAVGALLLAAGALGMAVRWTPLTARRVLAAAATQGAAVAAGVAFATLLSLPLPLLLGRPYGWFARPWLAWLAYGSLALAMFLGVHAAWRRGQSRTDAGDAGLAALGGALVWWSAVLALLQVRGLGAAYLALPWVVGGALGLALWTLRPRLRPAALALAWFPGALLTLPAAILLVKLFVPVAGRFPVPFPFDPVIAALVALPVAALAVTGVAVLHPVGGLGRGAGALALAGAAGLLLLALVSPYTPERAKRLMLRQVVSGAGATLEVQGADWISPAAALRGMDGAPFHPGATPRVLERPASIPALPPLRLRLDTADTRENGRTVRLHVGRGSPATLTLRIPAERLTGWSLGDTLPPLGPGATERVLRVFPPPDSGWTLLLRLRGEASVPVKLAATWSPAQAAALQRVLRDLPAWTVPQTEVVRQWRLRW